ncbi:hypothetical protein [uncultured Roseibium sp.]|uniref:hypothetical protein n=1 Tax=uncultured Roseibium sp. TaxID=1936171 RepID=UPI00260B37A6|nr:hypothetical protein [uncultured Roseibium sp.]
MLDDVFVYRGRAATAKDHCRDLGLSERIVLWRISKGRIGDEIFAPVPNPILFEGDIWTVTMLAEKYCLDDCIVRERWARGARGLELVAPLNDRTQAQIQELKKANKEFLRRLLKHHRSRGIAHLKAKKIDHVEEPFDTAAALLNAQRFEDAAKGYQTASTGFNWEYAA